jgi:hypothetical protein
MRIPDGSRETYIKINDGNAYTSIGWLGNSVPSKGAISDTAINEIKAILVYQCIDEDSFLGSHRCEICNKFESSGSFWVQKSIGERWMIPKMIVHYIQEHGYLLKAEIIQAIHEAVLKLPSPIINHEIDHAVRSLGLEPVGIENEEVMVHGIDLGGDKIADLQFVIGKPVRLA